MDGIRAVSSFFFGDSKTGAIDTQKLKADILLAFDTIEEFLGLREALNNEGILITCRSCNKGHKIHNPKNVAFVASYPSTTTQESSRYKGERRVSQKETSVDRSQQKVFKGSKIPTLSFSTETQGDDSHDDTKSHENDDKFDKEKLKDEMKQCEKNLREAREKNSNLQEQIEEMKRKYDLEIKNAAIELSKLTGVKESSDKSIECIENKLKEQEYELSKLKKELAEKEKKCRNLQNALDSDKQTYENIVSQMNTEQDNFRAEQDKMKSSIENLTSTKRQLTQDCHKKDEEIRDCINRISTLTNKCSDQEKQLNSLKRKYTESLDVSDSKSEQIDKLKEEAVNLSYCGKQKDEEIRSLERKVSESEKKSASKSDQIDKLNEEAIKLHRFGKQKDEEIQSWTQKVTELQKEMEIKRGNIRSLEQRIEELLSDVSSKGEQIEYMDSELRTMQRLIEDERKQNKSVKASLEEEILGLKADLNAWEERSKKTLAINFHTSLKQSLALPAKQHIEHCIKERCQSDKITLEVRQYSSPDKTPGPILVLCMNVSRLGTDVKEALKGTPGNFEVLVVVLHHKEVHALPSQASDRVLTGEEYKQLGAIVDAAFWTGKGMYDCDLNKMATEKIYNFVSGFVTTK